MNPGTPTWGAGILTARSLVSYCSQFLGLFVNVMNILNMTLNMLAVKSWTLRTVNIESLPISDFSV